MRVDAGVPVGRAAAELRGAIPLFDKLGIDYTTMPDLSVADAARSRRVEPERIVASLRRIQSLEVANGESWSVRPLTELAVHLNREHHHFIRHEIGRTATILSSACASPADVSPRLLALDTAFTRLADVLVTHLADIEAMARMWAPKGASTIPPVELLVNLRRLEDENDSAMARLRTLRECRARLAIFVPLSSRCRRVLERVAALEKQLVPRLLLERWVLFPQVCVAIYQKDPAFQKASDRRHAES